MKKVLANHLGDVFQNSKPLSKVLHKKSNSSTDRISARILRTFEGIDPIEESHPNSPMATQPNETIETEEQQPKRKTRRAVSAKDIHLWKNPHSSDVPPLIRRQYSDKSLASVRSTCRTLTQLQCGADSTEQKLFEGGNFFTTSSPTPSHGFSFAELAQNEMTYSEVSAFRKRAEDLVNELLRVFKQNYSRFHHIASEGNVSLAQIDDHALNEKAKEVLESMMGNAHGLGAIEWETKLESFKKELNGILSQNNMFAQSTHSSLMRLVNETKNEIPYDPKTHGKMGILVKELSSLLFAKRRMIRKLDTERKGYEKEKHGINVLLGSKEEELNILKGKVEKLTVENKQRETSLQSQLSDLTGNKTLLEAINSENLALIQTQKQEKDELISKHSSHMSILQRRLDGFVKKATAVEEANAKATAKQQENGDLRKQLENSREKIQKLKEKISQSRQSSEERVSKEKVRLDNALADVKKQLALEIQQKNQEITRLQTERERYLDLSVVENKTIRYLKSDAELLKKRLGDLKHSYTFREYSFQVESNQLNRKLADLSLALQRNKAPTKDQTIVALSPEVKQTSSKFIRK